VQTAAHVSWRVLDSISGLIWFSVWDSLPRHIVLSGQYFVCEIREGKLNLLRISSRILGRKLCSDDTLMAGDVVRVI
jgi:hypothetical protein